MADAIPSQQIRFCSSRDGTRLAYAVCGSGPPIVRSLQWGTHLELDWHTPVWRAWLSALSRGNTLIRYDSRGCGLSDREVADLSHERHLEDLDAVVQACGLKRFALLGMTGGGPSAVTYAVRHADRVTHLVLYGTFLRGRLVRSAAARNRDGGRRRRVGDRVGHAQAQLGRSRRTGHEVGVRGLGEHRGDRLELVLVARLACGRHVAGEQRIDARVELERQVVVA